MRTSSFTLRLEFSEAEYRDLAQRAFELGVSIYDYIHQALTARPKNVMPPAWPSLRTRIVLQPLDLRSNELAAPEQPSVAALTPEPPAPTPAAEVEAPAPEKRTRASNSVPDPAKVPLGWDRIIEVAPKVADARRRTIVDAGANKGILYNRTIARWYQQNGLGETDNNNRSALAQIGENLPAILTWHAGLPAGVIRDDTTPALLLRWWQEGRTTPSSRGRKAASPAPPPSSPAMPELRRGHVPNAGEMVPVFGAKGIRYVPADELFGSAPQRQASEPEPEIAPVTGPKFDSFGAVDLAALNPYDQRVLRRFHERMMALGVDRSPDLSERDIALAIRKIRGNESGDNPPTAMALLRLGVLHGKSGAFRFRKEYLRRFGDVTRWTLGFQVPATVPDEEPVAAK